ncbi:hypothetical protein [Ralstonia pseudosolanacearum]|uniref:hypothetical protein n=1 Tax=Ralstonia pseudosolanacearum TaxID=1310165 RepID=UPI001FF9B176|nr:hypothetical protein [Ralstonia pseudosolanacearum]
MKKSFTKHVDNLEFEGIPCGALTMEQVIESDNGKEAIRLLKKTSNDPDKLVIPFLVAYQIFDIECQLTAMGCGTKPASEERSAIINLATTSVAENLVNILTQIGAERLEKLRQILSPDAVTQ